MTEITTIPKYVKGEIYLITCICTHKNYIGQTRTHMFNKGKFRPFGSRRRFTAHISEAIRNTKKKQCIKLNNAIRKYGSTNFRCKCIYTCNLKFLNHFERVFISEYNSFYNGYNLTEGGNACKMTKNIREKISSTVKKYFEDDEKKLLHSNIQLKKNDLLKIERYKNYQINNLFINSYSNGVVYILIKLNDQSVRKRITFTGRYVKYEDALERAKHVALSITNNNTNIITVSSKLNGIIKISDTAKLREVP